MYIIRKFLQSVAKILLEISPSDSRKNSDFFKTTPPFPNIVNFVKLSKKNQEIRQIVSGEENKIRQMAAVKESQNSSNDPDENLRNPSNGPSKKWRNLLSDRGKYRSFCQNIESEIRQKSGISPQDCKKIIEFRQTIASPPQIIDNSVNQLRKYIANLSNRQREKIRIS